MGLLGILGIILSFAAYPLVSGPGTRTRVVLFVALVLLHLASAVAFYLYVQAEGGDAGFYYEDPLKWYGRSGVGTTFILNFVQFTKLTLGGSFLDHSLLFQAFGAWGVVFLLKIFDEIYEELQVETIPRTYLLLFLPGIHFWTSGIGKDGLLFLGVTLALWAAMRLRTRLFAFGFALAIMLAVRPHIALIALATLSLTIFFDRHTRLLVRVPLLLFALGAAAFVAVNVQSTFRVDLSNAESVSDFFARGALASRSSGGDVEIGEGTFVVKLFSLLFRPFFYDASSPLAYVASVENLIFMIIIGTILWRFSTTWAVAKRVFFARFALLFALVLIPLLAKVSYDVGLGLRQKVMAMPSLLIVFVILVAIGSLRSRLVEAGPVQLGDPRNLNYGARS